MHKLPGIIVVFSLLIASVPLPAQTGTSRLRKKSPRAVAVMDIDNSGRVRLLPVSLFMDGKFYDAGLYMSKPAPTALEPETVYEGIKSGVPQGLFTVEGARRVEKSWWGEGKWKAYGGSSDSASKSESATGDKSKPALKDDDDSDRPVLKRPKAEVDKDKKDTKENKDQANASTTKEAASEPPADDPDRPMLRRGRPAQTTSSTEPIKFVTKLPGTEDFMAAVSDSDPATVRPYVYPWPEGDREVLTRQMKELAAAELRKAGLHQHLPLPLQAKAPVAKVKTKPVKTGQQSAGQPPSAPPDPLIADLLDVKVAAFDLDYNNSPQIVLTARYVPKTEGLREVDASAINSRRGIFVAVVGRVNFEAQLQKMFAAVSDPTQLDNSPEYAFVDAVDVDGDGRAELLFQRLSAEGRSFAIYRVAGASMSEVFETTPR